MSMCESILTIALVCTVKYLHYCDYYYTLGNDSQSTPKLIAYENTILSIAFLTSIYSNFVLCFFPHYAGNNIKHDQPKNLQNYMYCNILRFFYNP